MAPSIPDRWIPYKACGLVIEGTRFICFKVPLRKTVQQGVKEIKEIWDIKTLLQKIPNLGAVIDLTNTARYYNPSEFQKAGILHKKILMPGRVIPPEKTVQEFINAVDEFLGKNCDSLIGVHCTHGLNRTGYMVCRYMRDRMGFNPKDAIYKFEIARGYKIERDNYIADLIGEKPPPPAVGKPTKLKPLEDIVENEREKSSRSPPAEDSPYNGGYSSSRRNRGQERQVRSWRDECIQEKDDNSVGRYVRYPYNNSWRNERQGNVKSQDRNSRARNNSRSERNRTDSESSYDYRYDY